MSKKSILIVGLLTRHHTILQKKLSKKLVDNYEISIWTCDKSERLNTKSLKAASLKAEKIYAIINKLPHNIQEVILGSGNREKYITLNGGASHLIEILNAIIIE